MKLSNTILTYIYSKRQNETGYGIETKALIYFQTCDSAHEPASDL